MTPDEKGEEFVRLYDKELRQAVQTAVDRWVREQLHKWADRHLEAIIRTEIQGYVASRVPEIRTKVDRWFQTRVDGVVETIGRETMAKLSADIQARVLGRK